MNEQAPQATPQRGQQTTIIAALVLLACLIGAAVALSFAGLDPAAIIGLMTGIAGIGATLVGLLGKLSSLHQVTTKIDRQTNGILTERIQSAVREELDKPIGFTLTDPEDHS